MFQCPLHMFLFMGPLHSLRDTIIHWKKIEFERRKKVSIFAQSLIGHYFRGPHVGCSWWAPARGCPHFSNFWKSPKNEASRAKKLKFSPTLHRGGSLWPPLATLEPHSSNMKAWFGPISIWIWSHGYQLWPRPKKSFKISMVFELCKLWRNDQKRPV